MPYLKLWHGRRSLDEDLDGWGSDGPIFGPFPFFHLTYASEIRFGEDFHLEIISGMVWYDGIFYGDWSFIDQLGDAEAMLRMDFDPMRSVPPPEAYLDSRAEGGDI